MSFCKHFLELTLVAIFFQFPLHLMILLHVLLVEIPTFRVEILELHVILIPRNLHLQWLHSP